VNKNAEYKRFIRPEIGKTVTINEKELPLSPTPPDIEGPFYKPNAPPRADAPLSGYTIPTITISGFVVDIHRVPIKGAVLDVWHADAAGEYDHVGFKMRGVFFTDENGYYKIRTIVPGEYKISDEGEPDDFRCPHIHFKVRHPQFKELTTQLYFPDNPHNASDHWFDSRRVIKVPDGEFQFVLECC